MISRYSRPEMAAIWSPEGRFGLWLEIETLVCEASADLGLIPSDAAKNIRQNARVDTGRILELEEETRHEVVAFLNQVGETMGDEARHFHMGLTSSDVMDTCFNLQLMRATDLLIADVDKILIVLKRRAFEFKNTPCMGRTHGVHAEPTTFGLKFAYAHAEFARNRARLETARSEIATCVLSGAVGTFATIDPRVEEQVAAVLGLEPETISTQCSPRDRHAAYFAALGVVAGGVERLAAEIRHWQQTEIGEAEEAFGDDQKGSSAMPHKRNPIFCEQLTGVARIVRRNVDPALDSIALWYEHEMSHSPVERTGGPDATIALDFALARLTEIVDGLDVKPDAMERNINRLGGAIHSQRVLLALLAAGMPRDAAYAIVQEHAQTVVRAGGDLLERLKADDAVSKTLEPEALEALFDLGYHTKHVETIFQRVFGDG